MRRLAALAITMLAAWLVIARGGASEPGSAALALGVALIAASIVGWLFQFLRLPRITGYLTFGLLCGPYVANIIRESMARDLQVANGLAIAVIGLIAGLELNFNRLRPRWGTIVTIGAVTIALAWVGLSVALYFAWSWLPIGELAGWQRATAAALTAAVIVGFSPTITIAA